MNSDEILKTLRSSKGMSQADFANYLDVSISTISNIENGSRDIPKTLIKQIMMKMSVDANWLLTGEGEMFLADNPAASQKVPLLSQKVSCGSGQDWNSEQNIEGYIDIAQLSPKLNRSDIYAFRAAGTSMLGAGIRDGDIVLFMASQDQTLVDGIYVFSLDGDAYCKRLEFDPIASRIKIYSVRVADLEKAELLTTLTSTDPGYAERFCLFGRVYGWIHPEP